MLCIAIIDNNTDFANLVYASVSIELLTFDLFYGLFL